MNLPRPDVEVTQGKTDWGTDQTEIKISRDGKSRTYAGTSYTGSESATKEAVKKLLDDPTTAEFLPETKRP